MLGSYLLGVKMAETFKKLSDGTLEISKTADAVISTMSQKEIIGKIAEVQTKIDHLNTDLVAAEQEKAQWQSKLNLVKTLVKK